VPIIVNLDVMLAKRKMRLNTVAELVDITAPNLSILKTGKAKAIRFSTLEKLCEILECQPGDILEYRKEEGESSEPGGVVGAASAATSLNRG
jgi:putative transcriptional regulator